MKQKIFMVLSRIFLILMLLSMGFILIVSVQCFFDVIRTNGVSLGLGILALIGLLVLAVLELYALYRLSRRVKEKHMIWLLFLGSLFLHLLVILFADTPVVSDFKIQWRAAQQILAQDHSYLSLAYFVNWKNQLGFSIYEAMLASLWNSPYYIQIVNALWSSLSVLFVFLIGKSLYSMRNAFWAASVYAVSLFPCTYVSVLTNHIPALALILLAVWLLLCAPFRHQTVNVVIAGAALACSELLRPETILILVPFIVWQGFVFLKSKGKGMIMVLGSVLLLLGSYAGVLQLGDAAARVSGIAPQGVKSEDLYYKFLVGLNPHTMGRFSASLIQELEELQETGMSREEAELTLLQEKRPQGPDQWLRLLSRKSAVFWWERDLSWSLQGLHERYPISQAGSQTLTLLLGCLDSCQFFWVFLTLFASWRSLWRSGCAQHRKLFIPCIFFTIFFVYLWIEVQARYVYIALPFVYIMMAGWNAEKITSVINKMINTRKLLR